METALPSEKNVMCLTLVENLGELQCTFPQKEYGDEARVTYYVDEGVVSAMVGVKDLKELRKSGYF